MNQYPKPILIDPYPKECMVQANFFVSLVKIDLFTLCHFYLISLV